jgi:hypothetical protein
MLFFLEAISASKKKIKLDRRHVGRTTLTTNARAFDSVRFIEYEGLIINLGHLVRSKLPHLCDW